MENENRQVKLKIKGKIELPSIDVTKYIGKKARIETIETYHGQHGYYVKVSTEIIDKINTGKEPIELRASNIYGLYENKEGEIGWGENTKMGAFMKLMKAETLNELKDKEVIIQTRTSKQGTQFLTF